MNPVLQMIYVGREKDGLVGKYGQKLVIDILGMDEELEGHIVLGGWRISGNLCRVIIYVTFSSSSVFVSFTFF